MGSCDGCSWPLFWHNSGQHTAAPVLSHSNTKLNFTVCCWHASITCRSAASTHLCNVYGCSNGAGRVAGLPYYLTKPCAVNEKTGVSQPLVTDFEDDVQMTLGRTSTTCEQLTTTSRSVDSRPRVNLDSLCEVVCCNLALTVRENESKIVISDFHKPYNHL